MTAAMLTERAWRTMLTGTGHAELAAAQREYDPPSDRGRGRRLNEGLHTPTVHCPRCESWNWGTDPRAIEHAEECGR